MLRRPLSGFFFSSRRRHTRCSRDWSSDVCSSDLIRSLAIQGKANAAPPRSAWLIESWFWDDCQPVRSEEHTSELQSRLHLVCRLLLEKKKKNKIETQQVRIRNNCSHTRTNEDILR